MADIEILSTGDQSDDELLLTDSLSGGAGDDTLTGGEAIDEIEYPETLDDDPDPAQETELVKKLRAEVKERNDRVREREREIEALRGRKPVVRTKKPDLWEDCEGDPDKFEERLLAWKDNEAKADEAERAPVDPRRQQQAQSWQQELQTYKANAAKLGKPDFDAAETAVTTTLDAAQQSTIVMAAKDPARFIYALGKSPIRLAQLAEITNPIKLAAEVARIEGARIMARKEPANIDEPLRGGARLSSGPTGDDKAAKLLAAAEKDASKFPAYREHMRQQRALERSKAA